MINPDLVKATWKKIDDLVDWVKITGKTILGNALELTDNILGPWSFSYVNEKWGDKIPKEYVDNVEKGLQAFIDDDYNTVLAVLPESINEAIDIKQLPEDIEAAFITSNFNAGVAFIRYYAQKKKDSQEKSKVE
jgi:hypothetical protein